MELFYVAPVYLVADRDLLRLFEVAPGALSVDTQQALIKRVAPVFEARGMTLRYADDRCWILESPEPQHITTTPLYRVVGGDLHDKMPRGEDALRWKQLLNETQMVLHDPLTPVAEQPSSRMAEPSDPVNGVWIWRPLSLFETAAQRWRKLWQ
ncbi:MAG: hypothetical protein HN344_02755 [Gammaproteobacteria bacterium]|jgi:hypothetical protein|nr:hypothetical protein [Gammaproteobacteria bacterium]